ncbi:cytochrome c oxidase assembly protein CtaG/Cox11-domain-containing protein [Kockovaella imperatae]|uniref:Cytochrome c oxidase assembly protein CtaG/Cox11-domain-containing protein n=1 Tax=Kockovaella imperatae TaxID=4999 RepID=A0A1Y1U713_9TREE|nr:cytochrome c oxidase assembly protein CtaG/Cox11-domain-containing protein [Kockovaella imperatae]ORX33808.1 cytochrome c oxidase assembly protein CtaG/Cox11-domain-containing protein [Kockovaella imperatae]
MSTTMKHLISIPCKAGPSRASRPFSKLPPMSPAGPPRQSLSTMSRHLSPHPSSRLKHARSGTSTASLSAESTGSTLGTLTNDDIRKVWLAKNKAFQDARSKRNQTLLFYSLGAVFIMGGVTYAAIPLYRAFCSATGFAGTPITDPTRFSPDRLYTTPETEGRKRITVHFQATSSDVLPWKFEPQQRTVRVLPGETALAFYRAKNTSDKDIIGIATYNMTPDKIAPYFAKVECFCFEEQRIRAGEEVDLPVFFFIDRDIMDDPALENVDDIILSYTFFKARRNDMGHAIPDASEEAVLKSQGFDQYEHAPVKASAAAAV